MDTMAENEGVYQEAPKPLTQNSSKVAQTPALQKRRLGGFRQERTGEREELNGLAGK